MASITLKDLDRDTEGLFEFQIPACERLMSNLRQQKGCLVKGGGGSGKTFVLAYGLKQLQDNNELKSFEHESPLQTSKILMFTAKQIRIQAIRDLHRVGVKAFEVLALASAVRGSKAQHYLTWATIIDAYGNAQDRVEWDKDSAPDLLVVDECQMVRNDKTKSAQLVLSFREQFPNRPVIFMSATPFSRFSEFKVVAFGLKVADDYSWLATIKQFCGWRDPSEFHPEIMRRLADFLDAEHLCADLGTVIYPKKAVIQYKPVDFENDKQRQFYQETEKRLLKDIEEAKKKHPNNPQIYVWMLMQQYRIAAEVIKSGLLARKAHEIVTSFNKQVMIATNFVGTRQAIAKILVKRHGVDPSRICVITGQQSDEKRQVEIDKWQAGKADYLLLSMKLGVGINLHHDSKASRPRHVILPCTWSVFEAIQTLARGHRLTSRSTTYEDIVFFPDTIEAKVIEVQKLKGKSMRELLTRKAGILDVFDAWTKRDLESHADELIDDDGEGNKLLEETIADNLTEAPETQVKGKVLLNDL